MPQAVVRKVNGRLVLDDPVAVSLIGVIAKQNCKRTFELNNARIAHFKQRITERSLTPAQAVIVVLNVDDINGALLAEALMPGYNWQEIRDRGEVPFARGLADRAFIQEALGKLDREAAKKLKEVTEAVGVVVVDHGVAETFTV